jgi:3-oxoacyl-[acyl-carrier protein] reductase
MRQPAVQVLVDGELGRVERDAVGTSPGGAISELANSTLLKRLPTLADVGNIAAFVASDKAGAMTGTVVQIDCGAS